MWSVIKRALGFILLLALLPLVAVFLLKLLIMAGTWTLASLDEPLYEITAGVTAVAVLAIGIWLLVGIATHNAAMRRQTGTQPYTYTQPSERATAYCNTCGKLNWADVPNCQYCRAQMSHDGS